MKASDWVSIEDDLPVKDTLALVVTKYGFTYVTRWNGCDWVARGWGSIAGVTHWTEIVKPNNN